MDDVPPREPLPITGGFQSPRSDALCAMSKEALVMVMYGIWIPESDGDVRPVAGRCEVVPLRPELLAAGGSVANPRVRTIGLQHHRAGVLIGGTILYLLFIAVPWLLLIGLFYALGRFASLLWPWAEPVLAILGIGVALAVIVIGIGLPG